MVRSQQRGGCTIVDWSLPEGEVGGVIVTVDVREQDLDPDDTRMTWCPVCHGASAMRSAETPDGRRFDLCDGCGLLWHVDRNLGRVTARAALWRLREAGPD